MQKEPFATAVILAAALGTAQGSPPETTPMFERDGLRLTINAEEIPWQAGIDMSFPYSVKNVGASSFHGCVLQKPEWKFYAVSGQDLDQVVVVDHVLCELEFTLLPGESASGIATTRGPATSPREAALSIQVLHLPIQRDSGGHYVTTTLESTRIRVNRSE